MSKIRGIRGNDIYLGDEFKGLTADAVAKIKRGLKKSAKVNNKKKHIYFNEEWNHKQ